MIPKDHIVAWATHAPWPREAQVEQDLLISRAIVAIFSDPELAGSLAFRGGTALYKLYLAPAARYSEDIDLVQVRQEPIGETLDRLRSVLDPWLGTPRRQFKEGRVNLMYRFASEDTLNRAGFAGGLERWEAEVLRNRCGGGQATRRSSGSRARLPRLAAGPLYAASGAATTRFLP